MTVAGIRPEDASDTGGDARELPPGLHVGREGWLFLVAGSNNVVGQFSTSPEMTYFVERWRQVVTEREARARRLGARYLHLVVPEKLTVYDHKLAGLPIDIRLAPSIRLRDGFFRQRRLWLNPRALVGALRASRACVDLVEPFRSRRDEADLYHRTDTHWSFEGCLIGYGLLCRAAGARPRADLATRPRVRAELKGDLGTKLHPPVSEPVWEHRILRDAARTYASPIVRARESAGQVFSLHVGAHVIFRNEGSDADPRRVVLFGDSYAHFALPTLTQMMAESFREVHFIWSASIDWGYVERVRPDLLVAEIAERFMHRVPDDRFDLESHARAKFGAELERLGLEGQAASPAPEEVVRRP